MIITTPHIKARSEDFAPRVLTFGDPLRGKNIAEKFLDNVKEISNIRNITIYSGTYKGVPITLLPHGMGMPSAGIYFFEAIHYFKVKHLIRIGTCGSHNKAFKLKDIVVLKESKTLSSFPMQFDNKSQKKITFSKKGVNDLIETAKQLDIDLKIGSGLCLDVFYTMDDNQEKLLSQKYESDVKDMESFLVGYFAKKLNINGLVMLKVVDADFSHESLTPSEREKDSDKMAEIALEYIIKQKI